MKTIVELVDHRCRIVFNLASGEWPIPGYPAWANCDGVESGMICLDGVWYSLSIIMSISEAGPRT